MTLTDEQNKFIEDWISFQFNKHYFNAVYPGYDQWLKTPEFVEIIVERKKKYDRDQIINDAYKTKQISALKDKCLNNLIAIVNDPKHKDHTMVSLKILAADLIYTETKAKASGEKAAMADANRERTESIKIVIGSDEHPIQKDRETG